MGEKLKPEPPLIPRGQAESLSPTYPTNPTAHMQEELAFMLEPVPSELLVR